jgi:hypothetical protein
MALHPDIERARQASYGARDSLGGIVPESMARARAADLITLPSYVAGTNCGTCQFFTTGRDAGMCTHKKVNMPVSTFQCCIYWDAPGTYRAWEAEK